jgi:hypothetical protein
MTIWLSFHQNKAAFDNKVKHNNLLNTNRNFYTAFQSALLPQTICSCKWLAY